MRILLLPLSLLYGLIVFVRNKLYDWQIFKVSRMNAAVISVGNLTTGGGGKTPLTEYIAEYFLRQNRSVAIVMKGYKRIRDDIQVAEIGYINQGLSKPGASTEDKLTCERFGDEGMLLLENLSDMRIEPGKGLIIVSDDKRSGARLADKKFKPNVIILDDGFQHRAIARNLDILLLTDRMPRFVLPSGNLREPLGNMKRADLLIFNRKFQEETFDKLETKRPGMIVVRYEFDALVNASGAMLKQVQLNEGMKATVFCGVAEPQSFIDLMNKIKADVNVFMKFPDHHNYKDADIESIITNFERSRSDFIFTTQKDMVRLKYSKSKSPLLKKLLYEMPFYCARIRIRVCKNETTLQEQLNNLTKTA